MLPRTLLQAIGLAAAAVALPARADELLVSGFLNGAVLRHDGATGDFIAPLGPAYAPTGLTRGPDGHLYVASGAHEVLRFDGATGAPLGVFASDETGLLDHPTGVAFAADGSLCVGSYVGDRVVRFDGTTGALIGTFVESGSGGLRFPESGMTFGPDGNLYVPSGGTDSVLRYDGSTGAFLDAFVPPRTGGLAGARAIAFDPTGTFAFVVSHHNGLVLRFDAASGAFLGSLFRADRPVAPTSLAFTGDGDLLVTSTLEDAVRRYDGTTGAYLGYFIAPGEGGLYFPWSILLVPEPRLPVEPPDAARAGEPIAIRARGAGPGERVAFAFSRSPGTARARACGPLELDLASPRLAGVARADASGVADLTRFVPARFAGVSVLVQALAPDTCRKSDALLLEFPR